MCQLAGACVNAGFSVSALVNIVGWMGILPVGTEKAFLAIAFAGKHGCTFGSMLSKLHIMSSITTATMLASFPRASCPCAHAGETLLMGLHGKDEPMDRFTHLVMQCLTRIVRVTYTQADQGQGSVKDATSCMNNLVSLKAETEKRTRWRTRSGAWVHKGTAAWMLPSCTLPGAHASHDGLLSSMCSRGPMASQLPHLMRAHSSSAVTGGGGGGGECRVGGHGVGGRRAGRALSRVGAGQGGHGAKGDMAQGKWLTAGLY